MNTVIQPGTDDQASVDRTSSGSETWFASPHPTDKYRWFVQTTARGKEDVCEVSNQDKERKARLIAAAPDFAGLAPRAARLLEQYAEFIRRDVSAADLTLHPYLPELEQVAEELRAAVAKAKGRS